MKIEERLEALGLALPEPLRLPPAAVPQAWTRRYGDIVYVSGHGPQNADGTAAGPFGKVGAEVSPEQAYQAARLAALSILGSLKRELGDLDRVAAWLRVRGSVNVAPDFVQTTQVMHGFSELILALYGEEAGTHARSAIGVASTPLGLPVIIEAEVAVRPDSPRV